jgi:hypothetical protein
MMSQRGRRANLPFNKDGRIAPYTKDPNARRPFADQAAKRQKARQLLVADSFTSERLNDFANKYWAPHNAKNRLVKFQSQVCLFHVLKSNFYHLGLFFGCDQ